jgi:hypothetical protein
VKIVVQRKGPSGAVKIVLQTNEAGQHADGCTTIFTAGARPFSAALDREAPHCLGYDAERFTALTTARSDAVTMFGSMPTPQ